MPDLHGHSDGGKTTEAYLCFGVDTRDVSFSFTCFAVHDIPQVKLG